MGRFYFHLSDGEEITLDEEGTELPDLSAAEGEAVQAARELLAEAIKSGKPDVPELFVICGSSGPTTGYRTARSRSAEAPKEVGRLIWRFHHPARNR